VARAALHEKTMQNAWSAQSPPPALWVFCGNILRCSRYACHSEGIRQSAVYSSRAPIQIARSGRVTNWQQFLRVGRRNRAHVHIGDWHQTKSVHLHVQTRAACGWQLCSARFANGAKGDFFTTRFRFAILHARYHRNTAVATLGPFSVILYQWATIESKG
jgi:hypothetical protein